jgi:predicted secreted protein
MAEVNPPVFLQAGSHPAETVRRFVDAGMDRAGIVNAADLAVTQNGSPNMSVNVAQGRAFVSGTEGAFQGMYLVEEQGTKNLAIAAADPTNPRKDLVVAKVQDAAYSGVTNAWSLAVVTGTPAPSPVEPAVPANALVLAMVNVAALATSITNANITDRRTTQTSPNQAGQAASLGGVIICLSTARPPHKAGRPIYETDTKRVYVSDGTNWTQVNPGIDAQTNDVATGQTTTSTTYTDLTTVGPAVTVHLEPGQKCEVIIYSRSSGDAPTTGARMSYAVSGAETIAAATREAANDYTESDNTTGVPGQKSSIFQATTGGTYTFTAKYRRLNATTATFADRRIIAKPL